MKIYQIDSSARKEGSTSRSLAKKLLEKIKKPDDEVIYRDLNDEMVFVSGLTESGMNIDEKDQNENHKKMFKLSDQLVKELKEHDIELITYKYPDHYQFRESDIPKVDQPILVTEKDFVKIKLFCNENVYILEQNIIPNDKLLKLMEKLS